MMKAPAPMMGGINWPPVDAAASTPPAMAGLYPILFIKGMVKEPVATVFATALPETDPMKPLEITAIFAGPPTRRPVRAWAKLMMKSPAPDFSRKAPKRMKR